VKLRRILAATVAAAALYFTIFGGEYGLFALRRLERQRLQEAAAIEALRTEVAALRARQDSLENDPATLERIARERYGMVRSGERLYRFTECPPGADGAAQMAGATRCGD
jgi:cell division protein FtsB